MAGKGQLGGASETGRVLKLAAIFSFLAIGGELVQTRLKDSDDVAQK